VPLVVGKPDFGLAKMSIFRQNRLISGEKSPDVVPKYYEISQNGLDKAVLRYMICLCTIMFPGVLSFERACQESNR